MTFRKESKTYYFSVEGCTEKWYLDWLENLINSNPDACNKVKLYSKVQKDPLAYAKSLTIIEKTKITHIFDYESSEYDHTKLFKTTLKKMKEAEDSGKSIEYQLGYSNFTFELWIILHKSFCNGSLINRRQYLGRINKAYNRKFTKLDDYKKKKNFQSILKQLTLDDVKLAIDRAKTITKNNEKNGYTLKEIYGYQYYDENPSLSIWRYIKEVLSDCKLY